MTKRPSDQVLALPVSPREMLALVEMGRMLGLSQHNVIRVALFRQAQFLDTRVDTTLFAVRLLAGGHGHTTPARRYLTRKEPS